MKKLIILLLLLSNSLFAQLENTQFLITSVRTGDTEIFLINPVTGDAFNITKAAYSEERYPAWHPNGKFITFRVTNEAYWRDTKKMKQVYDEKAGDKRPIWVMNVDGSNARIVEVLHYQCAMDGSRAEIYNIK